MLLVLSLGASLVALPQPPNDPTRYLFAEGRVVQVQIRLAPAAAQALGSEPRRYTTGTVELDGRVFSRVGVKLKGAAGSFRELDDRPGFTVHLGKFEPEQRFFGASRFHLNNCVQDESRLCEWLGSAIFAAAGQPAPRVVHARVRLDERDLGLYVLREAYDEAFLMRAFGHQNGNLYDGGFCQDIDAELEKDAGNGPDGGADRQALAELCDGIDTRRLPALERAIDVAAFVDFVALEAMLGHWDGYAQNANNYRLWLPTAGRAAFLPHGMDQLFGDPDASILAHPTVRVASAVMQQPALRQLYRARLRALLPLFAPDRLLPRVDALARRLQRELADDAGAAAAHADAVRDLRERLVARHASLLAQVDAAEPEPLALARGKPLVLRDLAEAADSEHIELVTDGSGEAAQLRLACKAEGREVQQGRFATQVLLGPGRYQLRCRLRATAVVPPPPDDDGNEQGGLRLWADGNPGERLIGTHDWRLMSVDFEQTAFQREVELAVELHAKAGRGLVQLQTLQLVRLE